MWRVFRGRVTEFTVGLPQGLCGARERLEQRLQFWQAAGVCIGGRARQPGWNVHLAQKVSVPRTLTGIM